jgi:hypothetical protein
LVVMVWSEVVNECVGVGTDFGVVGELEGFVPLVELDVFDRGYMLGLPGWRYGCYPHKEWCNRFPCTNHTVVDDLGLYGNQNHHMAQLIVLVVWA